MSPRRPGRPAEPALQRLLELMAVLDDAGPRGVLLTDLMARFGVQEDAIGKDRRHLSRLGWHIETREDNRGPAASKRHRYFLRRVDTRLAVRLTAEERAELHRVLLLLERPKLRDLIPVDGTPAAPPRVRALPAAASSTLGDVMTALRDHCTVSFVYSGQQRRVVPLRAVSRPEGWFLVGLEDGAGVSKMFGVDRMSAVHLDLPGSAPPPPHPPFGSQDAIRWLVHEPQEVTLRILAEHRPDAVALLGPPVAEAGELRTFVTTNRSAFRARVYELLDKVAGVPDEVFRAYLLEDLDSTLGPEGPA
jgi:predicted DNA-binding transcriptional regulator YafY